MSEIFESLGLRAIKKDYDKREKEYVIPKKIIQKALKKLHDAYPSHKDIFNDTFASQIISEETFDFVRKGNKPNLNQVIAQYISICPKDLHAQAKELCEIFFEYLKELTLETDEVSSPLIGKTVDKIDQKLEFLLENSYKKYTQDLSDEFIKKLVHESLKAVTKQTQIENPKVRILEALNEVSKGNTKKAEDIFQEVIRDKKDDIEHASEAYLHIGVLSHTHDINKAITSLERAVALNPNNIDALNLLGRSYMKQGEYKKATDTFCLAIRISLRDKDTLAKCQNMGNIALILQAQGEIEKAIKIHKKIICAYEKINNQIGIAKAHGNIGIIYKNMGEKYYDQALVEHRKSYEKNRELKNKQGMAASLSNIGIIYDLTEKYDDALNCYDEALAIAESETDVDGIAQAYINIAITQMNKKKFAQAETELDKAYRIIKKHKFRPLEGRYYGVMGRIKKNQKNKQEALANFNKAIKIFSDIGSIHLVKIVQKDIEDILQ